MNSNKKLRSNHILKIILLICLAFCFISGIIFYSVRKQDFLAEIHKQSAIHKFEKLDFDKNEAYKVYKDGFKFCEQEVIRTKNTGTGAMEGCIGEYFINRSPKMKELYNTVFDYCFYTNDCEADRRNCIYEVFNSYDSKKCIITNVQNKE